MGPAASAFAAPGETQLISRATGVAGAKGNVGSLDASISGNGRFVAFGANGTNVDPADTDALPDIYERDAQSGVTTLISRANGAAGAKGNGFSLAPSASGDGRFVAFESYATNLDPADTDAKEDIFVRDTQTATTTLASRASGMAGAKGNDSSTLASISADGRFVAFASSATNLDPADTDGVQDIFVRDLQTATTTLVSRASGSSGVKGNSNSLSPSISADGRYVAFESDASNLDPGSADGTSEVFLRDLQSATTVLVSRATGPGGARAANGAVAPSVSGDGRLVAFSSADSHLVAPDTNTGSDVFVRDVSLATTTLVSRASGVASAQGDHGSNDVAMASDGRSVAFASSATNLDGADADVLPDVFVRDLQSGATVLASRATGVAGVKGNKDSQRPSISTDGHIVAFDSQATNLDPADTSDDQDVYRRELSASARCSDAIPGVAGCWKFGEASGTVLKDASANHNDGTYLGGVTLGLPGVLAGDTAASFDGVNDVARVPDSGSLDVASSMSAEAWIKRSATTKAHELMNKGDNGLQLVVMSAASGNQVWLRKANVTTIARSTAGVPADGHYHHVVATTDGPNSARIYIDGVQSSVVLSAVHAIANTTFPIQFGGTGSTPASYDEFALYNRPLGPGEVADHYYAGTP